METIDFVDISWAHLKGQKSKRHFSNFFSFFFLYSHGGWVNTGGKLETNMQVFASFDSHVCLFVLINVISDSSDSFWWNCSA